jgi:hypothetical protein
MLEVEAVPQSPVRSGAAAEGRNKMALWTSERYPTEIHVGSSSGSRQYGDIGVGRAARKARETVRRGLLTLEK